MALAKPFPLYPIYKELVEFDERDYLDFRSVFSQHVGFKKWWKDQWIWGKEFLEYIGRNKSEHTYTRFRNEVERFLLWSFLVKEEPITEYRKSDVLEYIDFCWKPPASWISTETNGRFTMSNGSYRNNKKWKPFRIQAPKHLKNKTVDKKKYRPSQESLSALFTGITAFYKYLMGEEIAVGNPAQIAKNDCRYFLADAQLKQVNRLTEEQWQYLINVAVKLADSDARYERSLFIIVALKTMFLRISELSERADWSPVMGHFWEDENKNWWLKIYGKGRKLRDTSVPPDFLSFLERYRLSRGLSPLPEKKENTVLVEKLRGQGGMTARHLMRLVQEVMDAAYKSMKKDKGEKKAKQLKSASSHWLRHTGASMEIERGRALKDLSEDLGHSSMATTDTIYVQTESKKRAASGRDRKVV
ncbi:MAG: site-specific integrase [Pseudomonadales bacterium]|nr:site-specific integrase [Pseudomonadales bacterium]